MTTLIIVEDEPTAAAMQQGVDPAIVRFERAMFHNFVGARFERIFVRWPSPNWFEATHTSEQAFQDWVREYVSLRLTRPGNFQYF